MIGRCHYNYSVFVQRFGDDIIVRNGMIERQQDDQVELTLPQLMEKHRRCSRLDMKTDVRILPGYPVDDGDNDPDLRDRRSRTNTHLSSGRVRDGFDVFDPLQEFIKNSDASLDESAAIRRRLGAFGAAIEERHAKRVLHVGDGSRDGGLRNCKLCGGLCHASSLGHLEQNAQFMELESVCATVALHNATLTV